jgi:hypothetical protein
MNNLVNEIEVLKNALGLEENLRQATSTEFANGEQHGPMRQAHDAAIEQVVNAARRLVEKASPSR